MKWKLLLLLLILLGGGFVYLGVTQPPVAMKPVEMALDAGKLLK